MAARVQAGLAAAGIPFAVGIAVFPTSWCLATVAFVVAAVIVVLTFANKLPLLHRLPGLGAPRVSAEFIRIERNQVAPGFPFPMGGVYLQIALTVSSRIQDVVLSFFVPEGVYFDNVTLGGLPSNKGRLLLPSDELLNPGRRSQHWSDHVELRRGEGLMLFMLRLVEPDSFLVRVEIDSESLYRPVYVDYRVEVEVI